MGKFNLFRRKRERGVAQCINLSESLECGLVSQIRQKQAELARINKERNTASAPNLKLLIFSKIVPTFRNWHPNCQSELNMSLVFKIIENVDNVEALLDEIRTIHNAKKEEQRVCREIDDLKYKLGIK